MSRKKTEIWFTARNFYDSEADPLGWEDYIKMSRLSQLEELVSLDEVHNALVFEPDYETEIEHVVVKGGVESSFFYSIDYVKEKCKNVDYFNLLAVILDPSKDQQIQLERDFEFVGYDLLGADGDISVLTNGGGLDLTFHPKEQNLYGLISDYNNARKIQIHLPIDYPLNEIADCYLFEVWRHKFIGRNGSFNNDFCATLEYHLGVTFEKSSREEFRGFWCDGIMHRRIAKKLINDTRLIETTAWLGKEGQDEYTMTIKLGEKALSRFAKGTSMIDCIPDSVGMDWIEIDKEKFWIQIHLK
ncbi:MAG TPA: hypothetical protein PLY70_12145 [Saprospiraceae bacterium]|nr:hypothetical protein [Saprospiraceae bacterium]HPN68987.1 hypothetical protein [Saprospiraceae bacterium]